MKVTLVIFSFICFMNCCSPAPSPSVDYMIFDDVEYVNTFPKIFKLQNNQTVDIDIIGIKGFAIYDSLMILSTGNKKGFLSFISLPDYNHYGDFLTIGQGPLEFLFPVFASKIKLLKEDNHLFAYIYDMQKGDILKMDIDKSVQTQKAQIFKKTSISPFLTNFIMIDSSKYFCKELYNNQTQQRRYMLDNDVKITPDFMQKLNLSTLKSNENLNILSTNTKFNSDEHIIVEAPVNLNYLNIYSLDGSFGKTICIGNKLDNIDKIQDIVEWKRIETFGDLRVFNDFFGVLVIDEDKKTYQTKREKLPFILLFNWNGEPLAKLQLSNFITSFDIDFINAQLYTLDVFSDDFCRYDISNILKELEVE
jgi:hypothetical protein